MMRCCLCDSDLSAPDVCPQCGSLEGLDGDEDSLAITRAEAVGAREGKPVIFLDVDGVLNFEASQTEALEPGPLQRLALLLRRTGARVVLSSTWRIHPRLREKLQQALFLVGADMRDSDATDVLNWDTWGQEKGNDAIQLRCREIRQYLTDHPPSGPWVVLDDLPLSSVDSFFSRQNFVHVNPQVGLAVEDIARGAAILHDSCPRDMTLSKGHDSI